MKQLHYLAVLAAGSLLLASCSNDEVVSVPTMPQKAIDFKAMANKSTRADVTTSSLDRFRVFGCNMDAGTSDNHVVSFNSVYVTKADGKWTYQNVQYWAPNKDYYFVALSTNITQRAWSFDVPATHNETLSTDNFRGYGTVTMDLTKEIGSGDIADADQDLVYAYAARTTDDEITNSSAVSFTFHHMLSRLAFTFKNTFENPNYTFMVSDIQLSGLVNKASCTLGVEPSALVWTPADDDTPATVSVIIPEDAVASTTNSITSSGDYTYIIPGNQTLNITFDVTILLGGQTYSVRTITGTIAATDYAPGKSYMFTAEINQDNIIEGGAKPIEFTATVDSWGTNEEGSITI